MTDYTYPKPSGGYHWNMCRRIQELLGEFPGASFNSNDVILHFSRELTIAEKLSLDTLMASNPTQPPAATGTVFKIQDIWEKFPSFVSAANVGSLRIYFSESVPGSGKIDTIEIHCGVLTNTQKNKLKTTFANLITEA